MFSTLVFGFLSHTSCDMGSRDVQQRNTLFPGVRDEGIPQTNFRVQVLLEDLCPHKTASQDVVGGRQ